MIYIPSGKTGYFSLLSEFNTTVQEKGMECYFDADGTGRLMSVPGAPVSFIYSPDEWHYVQVAVDFNLDEAEFWFDGVQKYTWQWSQNGTVTSQLAANNFYGNSSNSEFYIDDYLLNSNCLYCIPPSPPGNLTVEELYNGNPVVQLNWEFPYLAPGFKVARKNGLPNDSGAFSQIGTSNWNENQYTDSLVLLDSTYTYGVMSYNIYGNSDTSNFESITVLPVPVELVSFNAGVVDDDISLQWTTATETNNKGFEVQRAASVGQGAGWEVIGFVPGNGTLTLTHSYSYTDKGLRPGKYRYRLKQIDFDGNYEYSKEVEAEVTGPVEFSLKQNYPNPFNPVTTIKYSIPDTKTSSERFPVVLKVYDILGNEAAVLVNEQKPAGNYEVKFDGSSLPSGVYIYRLTSGKYSKTRKLMLLK